MDLNKLPRIRNREESRVFKKVLRKSGKNGIEIDEIIELTKKVTTMFDTESMIKFKDFLLEGDYVKLNVEKIKTHPDWGKLRQEYKDFVLSNTGKIFTVKYDEKYCVEPNVVLLADDETVHDWLFFDGDILVLDERDGEYKELYMIELIDKKLN